VLRPPLHADRDRSPARHQAGQVRKHLDGARSAFAAVLRA
jgi:hypothetical protein